eukprot:jgi/Mesvir1/14490/Mv05192-RA.1
MNSRSIFPVCVSSITTRVALGTYWHGLRSEHASVLHPSCSSSSKVWPRLIWHRPFSSQACRSYRVSGDTSGGESRTSKRTSPQLDQLRHASLQSWRFLRKACRPVLAAAGGAAFGHELGSRGAGQGGGYYQGSDVVTSPKKKQRLGQKGAKDGSGDHSNGSGSDSSNQSRTLSRHLTNMLIIANIVVFTLQLITKGQLLVWGAKVNSAIAAGEWWRLITPTFLHGGIGHLMVNCYSLNSVGPAVERLCGPARFAIVYATAALAGNVFSFRFTDGISVGASGALFGLAGALGVYLARHGSMLGDDAMLQLRNLKAVIAVHLVLGAVFSGIDNWSHFGGLVGGTCMGWLLGPHFHVERNSSGVMCMVDRPPLRNLLTFKK